MKDTHEFDALYAANRHLLLVQTYALVGDLSVAKTAVRDGWERAWRQWPHLIGAAAPHVWVREAAWQHLRSAPATTPPPSFRSSAMPHPGRVPPEVTATLAALDMLTAVRRRELVVSHLADGDPATPAAAAAAREFAAVRGISTDQVTENLRALAPVAASVRWPSGRAVRGAHRGPRRTRSVVAVAATALITLGGATTSAAAQPESDPSASPPSSPTSSSASDSVSQSPEQNPVDTPSTDGTETPATDETEELTVGGMLEPKQLRPLTPIRTWRTVATTDNTDGNGRVLPCQQSRFADEGASGALLRSFSARPMKQQPGMQAWQFTELSSDAASARAGFEQVQQWYAGCQAPRMQLMETRTVTGVGNSATLFWLRSWRAPVTTYVVGVARTGKVTTTTVAARADTQDPDLTAHTTRLAAAVNALCGTAGSGRCAAPPSGRAIDPLPTGTVPGMLSEIDIPPATGVTRPWVGTEARAARQNFAATQCDETTFGKAQGVTNALTRTFVVPGGQLPDEFGLTQTVGTLPAARAATFFSGIRDRVLACAGEESGTAVDSLSYRRAGATELIAWRMRITISDQETVPYLMGIARNGTAVSQIGFFPAGSKTMGAAPFVQLVERAQRRLRQMPEPVTAQKNKSNNKNNKAQTRPRRGPPTPEARSSASKPRARRLEVPGAVRNGRRAPTRFRAQRRITDEARRRPRRHRPRRR